LIYAQVAYAPRSVPLAVPYTHLQTAIRPNLMSIDYQVFRMTARIFLIKRLCGRHRLSSVTGQSDSGN